MMRWILAADRLTAASRPTWGWAGQLGLVALGVHLAADRLDDLVGGWLGQLPLAWPSPEVPLSAGTWLAIGLELHVCLWAAWVLLRHRAEPVSTAREWLGRGSVGAVLALVGWGPLAAVGAWVVGMAVEDALAPWLHEAASPVAWIVALAALVRLGGTAWLQVLRRPPERRSWADGLLAAPSVVLITGLAVRHGLPLAPLLEWL